MKGYNRI